jgi:broad specificity phosphatase PhoE
VAAQQVYLIRHGETEWSRSGQHTGRTDVPLSEEGRRRAEAIGRWLNGRPLVALTSPLSRARDTCALAGYAGHAQVETDLREWDYGVYEGRTTADIRREIPDWSVWQSPIVDGESLEQLAARAQKVVARVLGEAPADVGLFAHGHILRVLATQWLGLAGVDGQLLALDTASVSMLGYERETRVVRLWNFQPAT